MDKSCTRCGKCCLHMRRYMVIERSIGEAQHYCLFSLTKERFRARIGEDYLTAFRDKDSMNQYPEACPFLRQDQESFYCTIYSSRPEHCKKFICS
ncbi:YkgJ family cysteine cluster protein [Methanospirillum stamsii]|uniref:YkgJ family cysteine cluster protein n=1 Tax=Methanospirillum stamsii TaxID=1277351 RepID=A0A2V2NAA5_9EURY|nr:YkgJ family cysteine cluster protein [Methanospirillum stamsii]PWR73418.1 hypothetical protein DLD82_09185 [Methanospirillum stamsii]